MISSSLRVSFELTTIPSPQRAWRTRSPSRYWRSPGMIGRGWGRDGCRGRRPRMAAPVASSRWRPPPDVRHPRSPPSPPGQRPGVVPGLHAPPANCPDRAPLSNASRRAARSRDGRNDLPAAGRAGPPAPLPRDRRPRPGSAVPNRLVRRGANTRLQVHLLPPVGARPERGPIISSRRDLVQEPRRLGHPARCRPAVARCQACDRYSRSLARVMPDVGQPALLLERLRVGVEAATRHRSPGSSGRGPPPARR